MLLAAGKCLNIKSVFSKNRGLWVTDYAKSYMTDTYYLGVGHWTQHTFPDDSIYALSFTDFS